MRGRYFFTTLAVYLGIIIYGIISGRYGVSIVVAGFLIFVFVFPGLVCWIWDTVSRWLKRNDSN